MPGKTTRSLSQAVLKKVPSGIKGLDEIMLGGLPKNRPTLICGGPGSGKTIFAMEFLVRGAVEYGEPGVFVSFEETPPELTANVASLGFDLELLQKQKKLLLEYIRIERSEIEVTGEYDLEGLFIRLKYAVESIGAKRIVLDTVESLFAGLPNEMILRAELRRLFRWTKEQGLTAIITGERGETSITRYGLEEYVSDCVIILDHRITGQVATRRLRIAKYRGTTHGTNEYPFLIDSDGVSILPATSMGLAHEVSKERVSTGIAGLDAMMGGKGYYKGTSVLVSGSAGTGKSTVAISAAGAACARGEKALVFTYEESVSQIVRNIKSIGMDLEPYIEKGLMRISASRASLYGLEMHLVDVHKQVTAFKPDMVIIDPISGFLSVGDIPEIRAMFTRVLDFLKIAKVTVICTDLQSIYGESEKTLMISSLMDTWLVLSNNEEKGRRKRALTIIKSRGMAHSNEVRPFEINERGIEISTGA